MSVRSRAERLVALGLGAAAVAIVALAVVVFVELEREARLHKDVIEQLKANEKLDALRGGVDDLGHAARIAALTGTRESREAVIRIAGEVESNLAALAQGVPGERQVPGFERLASSTRLLVLNARSSAQSRGANAQTSAREAERTAEEASRLLDATLHAQAARINRRALAQIQVGNTLRAAVAASIVVCIGLMGALYASYRSARRREAEALQRIEHLAHHDMLTGLPNRVLVADRLEQQLARCRREGGSFAYLVFDLDGFKGVNDARGHAAGDRVLRSVAQRAREAMRASDTLARVGGDEFVVVLPGVDLEGALVAAEKIRAAVSAPIALQEGEARVGASIGVAMHPLHGQDAEALQASADRALYEAKRLGKDRTAVARAPEARATRTATA